MSGGYLVTILGTGLTQLHDIEGHPPGLQSVLLANVAATIQVASSSFLLVLAGKTDGKTRTGNVELFSWQFGQATLKNAFTYYSST